MFLFFSWCLSLFALCLPPPPPTYSVSVAPWTSSRMRSPAMSAVPASSLFAPATPPRCAVEMALSPSTTGQATPAPPRPRLPLTPRRPRLLLAPPRPRIPSPPRPQLLPTRPRPQLPSPPRPRLLPTRPRPRLPSPPLPWLLSPPRPRLLSSLRPRLLLFSSRPRLQSGNSRRLVVLTRFSDALLTTKTVES